MMAFQSTMPGGVGVDEGSDEFGWVVAKDKPKYDEIFNTLEQDKGKVTGEILLYSFITMNKDLMDESFEEKSVRNCIVGRAAKEEMMKSHLPNKVIKNPGF